MLTRKKLLLIYLLAMVLLTGCGKQSTTGVPADVAYQTGLASWYGEAYQGRSTASGELFDMYKLTAAHRVLAFGTMVQVENQANGRRVTVKINDRGPSRDDRVIDLSKAAASEIGMVTEGTAQVTLRIVTTAQK